MSSCAAFHSFDVQYHHPPYSSSHLPFSPSLLIIIITISQSLSCMITSVFVEVCIERLLSHHFIPSLFFVCVLIARWLRLIAIKQTILFILPIWPTAVRTAYVQMYLKHPLGDLLNNLLLSSTWYRYRDVSIIIATIALLIVVRQ
jgi:hypothetical protein